MKNFLRTILSLKTLILTANICLIFATAFFLFVNIMAKRQHANESEILEPGTQFVHFKEKLEEIPKLGYITNKNLTEEGNDGFFLQAQYMLAPVILQLNEQHPRLNILDYKEPIYTYFSLRSLNAQSLSSSEWGPVLAETLP